MTASDNVLLSVAQIVDSFNVSVGAVRSWIAAGMLVPVRREGKGRDGAMYFSRGEVASLLHGICPVCGDGFQKATLKQRFCSKACRQRWSRMHKS